MRMDHLRAPLLGNAAFSASSGATMLFFRERLVGILGPDVPALYGLLGAGLMAFSLGLLWLSSRPRPLWVVAVIGADLTWILATTTSLAVWWSDFESAGVALVLAANTIVALLVLLQGRGLLRAYAVPGEAGRYEVCVRVEAPTDAARLWPVVADLGGIADHMPALASSRLEADVTPGEGAVRTCENTRGKRWSERCIRWREGHSFDVRFLTEASDFPFPFTDMIGGWRLIPRGAACDVEVWWRVVPRSPAIAALLLPLMAHDASRSFSEVVASMVARAEGLPSTRERTQLRVAFC